MINLLLDEQRNSYFYGLTLKRYRNVCSRFNEHKHITNHLWIELNMSYFSTRCQFHQHFTCAFFLVTFWVWRRISFEKCARKRLMKSTAGVDFINIMRTNFSCERHFSSYFLALLKNSYKKCARIN